MTIRDLKKLYYDNVCLYVENERTADEPYTDLFKGNLSNVPERLLDSEICHFGAKRCDLLDIKIKKGA